jgi:hypothetical protein
MHEAFINYEKIGKILGFEVRFSSINEPQEIPVMADQTCVNDLPL